MVSLTLKDIPPDLHRRLRERAATTGRSLNKEILACLELVTAPCRLKVPEYLSRVERCRDGMDFEVTLNEIQDAIEDGRP